MFRPSPPSSSDEEFVEEHQQCQPNIKKFYSDETYSPYNVDTLVNNEMMELNVKTRNKIYEEIHGVRCMAPFETPELLERSLKLLDAELASIPPSEKRAFCHASNQKNGSGDNNSSSTESIDDQKIYVNTDEFRLRFLRCELFNAKKAARRLVGYLDLIAYCLTFKKGLAVLQRPITLLDLDDIEQMVLRQGHLQILPFRDRSGRRILTAVASLGINYDPNVWYKILLYFLWIAGDDIESQQKGIVVLLWPNPDISKSIKLRYPMHNGVNYAQMIVQAVPVRVTAIHFCAPGDNPFFMILRSVLAMTLGKKRSRLKFHSGEPVELKYQAAGYGIPVDLIPMTSTGNVKTTYLKQWIRLRNAIEVEMMLKGSWCLGDAFGNQPDNNNNDHEILIECPGSNDVVFRPGRPGMNHAGNVAFRSLIESKSFLHDRASQTEKLTITKEVVKEMIEIRKGRFLIWNETYCCWKPIENPNKQRHKVAVALRNFKSAKKALKNIQTNEESAMSMAFSKLDHGRCGKSGSGNCCSQTTTSSNKGSDDESKKRKRDRIQDWAWF